VKLFEATSITTEMLRYILPEEWYSTLNTVVMSVLFGIPLTMIALYESQISHPRLRRIQLYFDDETEDEGDASVQDPVSDGETQGTISKTKFETLVSVFPK
jgi:hypothetical protein